MRRITILLFSSTLLLSSCHTLTRTARTADVSNGLQSATVVDLVPATEHRITYTLEPSKALQRGGADNIKQAAEAEALAKYGNADILLEPRYMVTKQRGLLRSKITSISVSGRPAYYTNFRALDDSVWCNPVFRGVNMHQRSLPLPGKVNPIRKKSTASYTPAYRTKGFAMYLTPFIGYGKFECEQCTGIPDMTSYAAFLSAGYQINPYIYLGAGVGINGTCYDDCPDYWAHGWIGGTYMPIYANARFNLSRTRNTMFLDGKMGVGGFGSTEFVGCGSTLFGSLALGYSIGNIDVAFQYIYHHNIYSTDAHSWSRTRESIYFRQYGLSVGFRF